MVVDTNVVVSALITVDFRSPPTQVLAAALSGRITPVLSPELLREYESALIAPRTQRRHRLVPSEVQEILDWLAHRGAVIEPGSARRRPPGLSDAHVVAILESEPRALLVTGDVRLRTWAAGWTTALSPRGFVELLRGGADQLTL